MSVVGNQSRYPCRLHRDDCANDVRALIRLTCSNVATEAFGLLATHITCEVTLFNNYTVRLDWITYYSYDLMDMMGRERFDNLKTYYEKIELENGLLISLQPDLFDWHNPEHRARLEQAYDELGLDDFRHDK